MTQTPAVENKGSSALLVYDMEFARVGNSWLLSGEFIVSLQVIASGLDISSVTNTGSSALFWVSGGSPGARHSVDVSFVTNFGQEDVRSVDFIIERRMYG